MREALKADVRVALAVALKELRSLRRYPVDAVGVIAAPIYSFLLPTVLLAATFGVAGRTPAFAAVTGSSDVLGYYVVGAVFNSVATGAFWGAGFALRREMMAGTLEPIWLVPANRLAVVTGYFLASLAVAGAGSVAMAVLGITAFHVSLGPAAWAAIPAFGIDLVAMTGVAYAVAALALRMRDPNFAVDAGAYTFSAAAGVMFPVTVLPAAGMAVSLAIPMTYALDITRVAVLGTRPLAALPIEGAALVVLSVAAVLAGARLFDAADRWARTTGAVGQY